MAVVRRRGSGDFSVGDGLQLIILAVGNIIACFLQPDQTLQLRLGRIAIMNLIPLFLGSRSNVFAELLLGLSPHWYGLMHRWLGRIFLVEAIAHALLHLATAQWQLSLVQILVRLLWQPLKPCANRRSKLLSVAASIFLTSILYFRRTFFELFLKCHVIAALGLMVLLWVHVRVGQNIGTVALIVATSLWIIDTTVGLCRVCARVFAKIKCTVTVQAPPALLTLDIEIPEFAMLKSVCHGRYIYLTSFSHPRHLLGMFQSHPYLIMWEDVTKTGQKLTVLIHTRRNFSNSLSTSEGAFGVNICGPYGKVPDFGMYDKVCCIASGVGIAAHLLTIKHLIAQHNVRNVRARRISLIWKIRERAHAKWAKPYLRDLFNLQENYRILNVYIVYETGPDKDVWLDDDAQPDADAVEKRHVSHRPDRDTPSGLHKGQPEFSRYVKETVLHQLITGEWAGDAGNMAISLCADPAFEAEVRKEVQRPPYDIDVFTSPFRIDP
ncbi:uncharacterized protein K489DRAFT_427309 [Dissoconium aciculare CBS 342.82]|uniref:FAD-binding FR-type domain-containing protein n=1 Tax=Dissoconium aciculare CBS 342.82 TaxID=1314786 RepID=A0A6J3MGP3_9PEZI|nr:uncharacterized protein K489DRAFT_427309 [Dissoconium aciculare CBS 342.82]KAF1826849.1 hypothetical protein K489DRAFT_427309 [Dissoconium aciculare CBS 342.82]